MLAGNGGNDPPARAWKKNTQKDAERIALP